jgi:rhamnosyltransferase
MIQRPARENPVPPQCQSGCEFRALACVIVTYCPDLQVLARGIEALPQDTAIVLIDNASGATTLEAMNGMVANRKRARIVANNCNLGLAAAINQGVREARMAWPEIRFVLLLDQDSEPLPGSIQALMIAYGRLVSCSEGVGCVGPALIDVSTGMRHGFHQCTRWRWRRVYPAPGSVEAVPCTNLNGSGTLLSVDMFRQLGGLEEGLFIDHVDTEWSFRVLAAGYSLWGIPNAAFEHRMGQRGMRFWAFGWRVWPARSPQRHYFLFRNAAILLRRNYVPRVWKFWAIVKLLLTLGVHGLLDPRRLEQLRCMVCGLKDGLRTAPARPDHQLS